MKKIFKLSTAAIALIAVTGCSSQDLTDFVTSGADDGLVNAVIDSEVASRSNANDLGEFTWAKGDEISVFNDLGNLEYELKDGAGSINASFAAKEAAFTVASSNEPKYAFYPYNASHKINGETLTITLPDSYNYSVSDGKLITNTNALMLGTYTNGNYQFRHIAGVLRLAFKSLPSNARKLRFTTSARINGEFTTTIGAGDNGVTELKQDGIGELTDRTVTIDWNDEITDFTDNARFMIPLPIGDYEGFTFSILDADNQVITKSNGLELTYTTGTTNTMCRRQLGLYPILSLTVDVDGNIADNTSYVVAKVTPKSTESETYILDVWGDFDIKQVNAVYIDGKKQDKVSYSYTFDDTNEHTVMIVMKDSFNDAYSMFEDCKCITSLDLSHLDTSKVTDMEYMFLDCSNLKTLDLSGLDTRKVTKMDGMFGYCYKVESLDLSSFDTSNVTNMKNMFGYCETLTSLDLSSFDTSSVTNMCGVFYDCENLESVKWPSSFNTSNVTNMAYLFAFCYKLGSIDLSGFDTSNVTDMSAMFGVCKALKSLDLSSFDTSNVTDMTSMFEGCSSLAEIKMKGDIKTDVVIEDMFVDMPSSGTFYYPLSKKDQYAKFFDGTAIANWTQVDIDSAE
jgi:surface protein